MNSVNASAVNGLNAAIAASHPNPSAAAGRVATSPSVVSPPVEDDDRYTGVHQYSLRQIIGLWAAAALPMGILAWAVAPWLSHHLHGPEPLGQAVVIVFNVGLVWILALTLLLVRRERGGLGWSQVRDALWLRAPKDPKSQRVGGRVWWWTVPFVVLSALLNAGFIDPAGPIPRDFPRFLAMHRAEVFYRWNWTMFALTVLVAVLSPVVEELFFRGLLLPRMRGVFGRRGWAVNGAIFAAYHVHQPWSMPASLLDGMFAQAYPTQRFRSTWIAIICHTAPAVFIIPTVLALVLK
jgi:membrane protease YdiL (CAAX protease family)